MSTIRLPLSSWKISGAIDSIKPLRTMNFRWITFYSLALLAFSCLPSQTAAEAETRVIDLSGTWQFELDEEKIGVEANWQNEQLADEVQLPGTTDENKKGVQKDESPTDRHFRSAY